MQRNNMSMILNSRNKRKTMYTSMNGVDTTDHDYEMSSMRRGRLRGPNRKTALQERLQDIRLFELTDDRYVCLSWAHCL